MRAKIVAIGNSKGIRLPKALLEQYRFQEEVELYAKKDCLVISRFDVYLVSLDPARGSEIRKTRPCLIISPD